MTKIGPRIASLEYQRAYAAQLAITNPRTTVQMFLNVELRYGDVCLQSSEKFIGPHVRKSRKNDNIHNTSVYLKKKLRKCALIHTQLNHSVKEWIFRVYFISETIVRCYIKLDIKVLMISVSPKIKE